MSPFQKLGFGLLFIYLEDSVLKYIQIFRHLSMSASVENWRSRAWCQSSGAKLTSHITIANIIVKWIRKGFFCMELEELFLSRRLGHSSRWTWLYTFHGLLWINVGLNDMLSRLTLWPEMVLSSRTADCLSLVGWSLKRVPNECAVSSRKPRSYHSRCYITLRISQWMNELLVDMVLRVL